MRTDCRRAGGCQHLARIGRLLWGCLTLPGLPVLQSVVSEIAKRRHAADLGQTAEQPAKAATGALLTACCPPAPANKDSINFEASIIPSLTQTKASNEFAEMHVRL